MDTDIFKAISELVGDIIPVIVSTLAIFLTFVTNKKIKNQIQEHEALKFSESFANIEYDISEILQLCVIKHKGIDFNNRAYVQRVFPFFIPYHRKTDSNMPPNDDPQERIYRLCGYICAHGSKKTTYLFNELQIEYTRCINSCCFGDISKIIALLAILVTQIKYDARKVTFDYSEWINIRLPNLTEQEKEKIFHECTTILVYLKDSRIN